MIETGQGKTVHGWVHIRRDHGKLIFIDLRTSDGILQCVITPQFEGAHTVGGTLRSEWVVEMKGDIKERPDRMKKADQRLGDIEMEVHEITVINESQTPPFDIDSDGTLINEELRLQYRYLDLRRERMHRNMVFRDNVIHFIRNYLHEAAFVEIETPLLTKSTPEGARDFLVPFRKTPGKFYALPQSPQQYKQLLMVAGIERYFQIARCMRDEDTRKDRQPEFTQLDMEMSFASEEDIMQLNEALLIQLVQRVAPHLTIQETPFPRITYADAMKTYGSDRPDLRKDPQDPNVLAFCWVVDFPFYEKTESGGWTFTHNPFSAAKPEHAAWLKQREHTGDILAAQYDIVLNGFEIGGGSIRNHDADSLRAVLATIGIAEDDIEQNFGHMLSAFEHGAPPHGGIAWGLDRLLMLLLNEATIREVIAFPKTGEGEDPMMQAPSTLSADQLRELGISVKKSAQ